MPESKISISEFNKLSRDQIPFFALMKFEVVEIGFEYALFRARYDKQSLRPGGTIAGPVMMGLADAAFYAAVMSVIGPVELAVTTNLSINFLRKPGPEDIYCRAGILKLGKRLTVCDAIIYSEGIGIDKPVAHATGTYSIPPG
jgi:uncharacterized protein (TIGR00369 family)